MLRPPKNISKCLLSTPCRFVGEFESDGLLVSHAWPELMAPNARRQTFEPGPTFRTYVIIAFETQAPVDDKPVNIPSFHRIGDYFAAVLSVFFGKRFDHHGLLETQGFFSLPAYHAINEISVFHLAPYNSKPRANLKIALNFEHLSAVAPLLQLKIDQRVLDTFFSAAGFYVRALRIIEDHPENAYLDLVTAGEILSNYYNFTDEELYPEDVRALLEEIRTQLPDGAKKAQTVKSRLFQVRRRYIATVERLLDSSFFDVTESHVAWAGLHKHDASKAIGASYDLRSRYVHTGEPFGGWVRAFEHMHAERQGATPVVHDKDYEKILFRAPTFLGLERMMRYCLLRFINDNALPIKQFKVEGGVQSVIAAEGFA